MAKKQINQAIEKLLRSATQLNQKFTSQERFWLLRSGFVGRQAQPEGGFVLPTVTLLLVMLSLVLGILIFRTGSRTTQVIGERQQRQIYNATTPAIERAKAKLEFLFSEEAIPALPSDNDISLTLLANDGAEVGPNGNYGRYTLRDETRVDINNDNNVDNAWTFQFDSDGDGNAETTVGYSILSLASFDPNPGNNDTSDVIAIQDPDETKADNLVVRNGPINLSGGVGNPNCPAPERSPFQGWQNVTGSALRKSIQVHAFASNPNTGVVSTLEMQQDKQSNLGNKWGAWFRNDMEIFPGPNFNWNGAMFVAGSYFVGGSNNRVRLYPVSSPSSCIYIPDNSEIVIGKIDEDVLLEAPDVNGGFPFRGHYVTGTLRDDNFAGNSTLYQHSDAEDQIPPANRITALTSANDSIDGVNSPTQVALDPVLLLTQAQNRARDEVNGNDRTNGAIQEVGWADKGEEANPRWWVDESRLYNAYQPTPFVDDTYRADNRWGPKPIYSEQPLAATPLTENVGIDFDVADPSLNTILESAPLGIDAELVARLTREAPPNANATDEESYGLDGYWERRAAAQGVRVIVGQRLELGNLNGWKTEFDAEGDGFDDDDDLNNNGLWDFDPLYPPPASAADPAALNAAGNFGEVTDENGTSLLQAAFKQVSDATNPDSSLEDRQHESRQWKTLRTNQAAAQSATLYHYLMDGGNYPVACIASAVHPGTRQTIEASTTFNPLSPTDTRPNVNFLTGDGTNGWEFYPPNYAAGVGAVTSAALETARGNFENDINDQNSDLRVALHNLAYFAGDPAGAFPPFQDTSDNNGGNDAANLALFRNANQRDGSIGDVAHPFPIQSMWGDFSNLRRVIDKLEGNAAYTGVNPGFSYDGAVNGLSLADQTTLQTAACTLGILAYNVDNVLNHDDADDEFLGDRKLFNAFRTMNAQSPVVFQKGPGPNGDDTELEVEYDASNAGPEYKAVLKAEDQLFDFNNPAGSVPPEVFVEALEAFLDPDDFDTLVATRNRMQIQRDRALGFSQGMDYVVQVGNARILGQELPAVGETIRLQCDFVANDYFGKGKPLDKTAEIEFLTIALTLCPSGPKYPSLAYIFPDRDHAHDGTLANNTGANPLKNDPGEDQVAARMQPQSEPYTSSTLQVHGTDFNNAYTFNGGQNAGSSWTPGNDAYQAVGDDNNDGVIESGETDFTSIALVPKAAGTYSTWAQPTANTETSPNGDDEDRINRIVGPDGNQRWLSFLDKGIFNGREAMAARVMDIDLDLLRRNIVTGNNQLAGTSNQDWWLPLPQIINPAQAPTRTGAAIYAFREDAVREDGIARPRSASPAQGVWEAAWLNYVNDTRDADYLMDAVSANSQDPPINPNNGLSPKAVDFYPDPDRRVHGFRLRNGIDLRRTDFTTTAVPEPADDPRGMSFVSDNPVYVQGEFNIHSTDGTTANIIQEFEQKLGEGFTDANFYQRTTLDLDFARTGAGRDSWRATEVVGDGITLLSRNYSGGDAGNGPDGNSQQHLDGWIAQGIVGAEGNFNDVSSFMSLNEPAEGDGDNAQATRGDEFRWVREDGTVPAQDDANNASPIKISFRGFPVYCSLPNSRISDIGNSSDASTTTVPVGASCAALGGEEREYGLRDSNQIFRSFDSQRNATEQAPPDTYMNMLMVSGTIPSRSNQSNGGLHNFPRFLERHTRLWIAGSIYQLNFSSAATGPFDQDSWEPDNAPQAGSGNGEDITYYSPPARLWGYDPALQLVQPAPVAQRFATPANIRSEFYRELPVDDPYIVNLRCAVEDQSAVNSNLCN